MAVRKPKIVIVGCGPGGLDYLTPAGRREIEQAQVLVGAPRLFDSFPESRAKRIAVTADIPLALDQIAKNLHRRVVVLVTGDPGLCSLAKPVISRFGRAACRVIAGISSVQAAFASVGVDWLNTHVITAHDRVPQIKPAELLGAEKIAVLSGHAAAGEWLATLARTLGRDYRLFLCSNLTLPDESVRPVTAARLGRMTLPPRSVVLLIRKDFIQ
jgi:cobalt-precorrin-7 (C5)-methyltransferase